MEKRNTFKEQRITTFLKKYGNVSSTLNLDEKIKLCSIDDFNSVAEKLTEKYYEEKAPTIISHVGGFYVTASLAGAITQNAKSNSKTNILFFDRKDGNIQNAIYNTLLMHVCKTKEEYITTLFGLDEIDIVKCLKPSLYVSYIEEILSENNDFSDLNKSEKKAKIKELYELDSNALDKIIKKEYISTSLVDSILESDFNLGKIVKYASKKPYDVNNHYKLLVRKSTGKLDNDILNLFKMIASNMCEYLNRKNNYNDLIKYLSTDIKNNSKYHILANNSVFNGYKSLIKKRGNGSVKFASGIDISKEEGVQKLKNILVSEGIITNDKEHFPIDIAFIPHINLMKEAYPFIKENVEEYINLNKTNGKGRNNFSVNSTATLSVRDYKSIGAEFIKEQRENRCELTHLSKIDKREGFPLISFIAGANFGNIYHSEIDTENMIDMAIKDGVDTVYIQGLLYGTYYHHQTSRRLLTDPGYESLDSRLKAAKKIVKRLNDAGIKVVYQMGDEEIHLYQDMFKIYVREQGVSGNNFLEREDLRSRYDWVRPIIIGELIPYLIRSGEDVTNFYTDEVKETRVSKICHALKLYKDNLPLGELSKYINPEYLKDTDMFKVVFNTVDNYNKNDKALSIDLLSNPNYSYITQYGKPNIGAIKTLRYHQTGSVGNDSIEKIPQLFVDSRQGFMSIAYQGDQATINVPQMIDDSLYIENKGLLPGIKEHILEDPTHKRVTQIQTRPNYPGGWTINGDLRERMIIVPYYKRSREVMEYVNKNGTPLQMQAVGYINDWQTGSPTERLIYNVKAMDYMFYEGHITGIFGNGDFQQGWNYPKFANESRHLGSSSVTQQMVSDVKLLRPFLRDGMGVIKDGFVKDDEIDSHISDKIISHLASEGLIKHNTGLYQNMDTLRRDIDYKTVNLNLPDELKPYEKSIRDKLTSTINLLFVDLIEGNHEYNTDWNNKGYNEIELLRQELESLKTYTGSDVDITLTEFLVNKNGDFVNAPYSFRTINGYNNVNGHAFKPAGKGGGVSPTVAMAKYLDQMAGFSNRIDRANAAHYHIFETSVIDNKLLTITGGGAGQSGFEQNLGYASTPCYVLDRYLPDGRIVIETIGPKFLDEYKIQNPYIKEKGLDKFIEECITEEATIYDRDEPKKLQKLHQRKLVAKKPNDIIGPKID